LWTRSEVEVVEVILEVLFKRRDLRRKRPRERRPPALLEDRELGALDAAIGVRAARPDPALASAGGLDRRAELPRAKLRTVVRGHLSKSPADTLELTGDPAVILADSEASMGSSGSGRSGFRSEGSRWRRDEREALGASFQPHAAKHAPDAVL
jgi:hypothetical protein